MRMHICTNVHRRIFISHTELANCTQVVVQSSGIKYGNGPALPRITQAYSSVVPPTLPTYPPHTPHKLARFVWTSRSDGKTDLKVFSPPDTQTPVLSLHGLYALPFTIPFPNTTSVGAGFLFEYHQTVPPPVNDPSAGVTRIVQSLSWTPSLTLGFFQGFESLSDELSLDGSFLPICTVFKGGQVGVSVAPFYIT
jgi:hypothetical protein